MNENPEGTPNPLNPAPSGANLHSAPRTRQDDLTMGTGKPSNIGMTSEPVEPASFTMPTEHSNENTPTASAMPEMKKATPVSAMPDIAVAKPPVHHQHSVVDPMMRPVSHRNPNEKIDIEVGSATEFDTGDDSGSFESLSMEDVSIDELNNQMVEASRPETSNLVAKDSVVEPAGGRKSKKPFIIGAIVLLMVAIICGAAAVAIVMVGNNNDRVSKAVDKLLNGEISNIVKLDGAINAVSDTEVDTSGPTLSLAAKTTSIDFDGTFDIKSSMNEVSAEVDAELSNGKKISIGVEEMRNKSGNVFFKISGLESIYENAMVLNDTSTNTSTSTTTQEGTVSTSSTSTSDLVAMFAGLFEAMNDEWILVSDDFSGKMTGLQVFDNSTTCLINAFGTLPQYAKDIASKYKANPFITYSTDKLSINKKKNALYRLGINNDKLAAFTNSIGNNGFINELNACAGNLSTNGTTSQNMIGDIFRNFPTMYAEIDDNNNFTRVYFETDANSQSITADLDISYPNKLDVTEPDSYIEMSTLLNNVTTNLLKNGSTI